MRKSESLQMLDMLGLNTIDYYITKDPKEATHYLALHMDHNRSMRTERGDEFLCPFYYNIPGSEILPKALKHLEEGYKLIFSPSLDWKDCIAFGATSLTNDVEDTMEVVFGPGLNRSLDNHPDKMSLRIKAGTITPFQAKDFGRPTQAFMLNTIYKYIQEHCIDQAPCIVEWSWYPYKVGKLNEYLICWELRGYK